LDLGDGRKAELNGSIDRVDTVILDDGRKAAMLYDFKSSVKEVRGEALRAGLQLQLPIYMIAAQNGMPDHMIAGALYQPVREIIVESDADDTDIIDKKIESDLCSRGIILDDERIRTAASPVKYKVNSSSSDIIRTVSEEGMTDVIKRGAGSACAVIRKMLDGETAPDPLQDGVSLPCGYCGARNACPFDTRIDGCRVRKLKNLNDVEE
nr:PD-(D/E)XK nuclease family protein [Clostridiales bacterium]